VALAFVKPLLEHLGMTADTDADTGMDADVETGLDPDVDTGTSGVVTDANADPTTETTADAEVGAVKTAGAPQDSGTGTSRD
jgi:hypothetical protein